MKGLLFGAKLVLFGMGLDYGDGVQPSVALCGKDTVIEVHKSEAQDTLWVQVGTVETNVVTWGQGDRYEDDGVSPAVAVRDRGDVVEVHGRTHALGANDLVYKVGTLDTATRTVKWTGGGTYDTGNRPSVALAKNGDVVEVHEGGGLAGKLWSRVGRLDGGTVRWKDADNYDSGMAPHVATNAGGVVVEVHQSGRLGPDLYYRVGSVGKDKAEWGPSRKYTTGVEPAVALTDDGIVIEVHQSHLHGTLWQTVGRIKGDTIVWDAGPSQFDDGITPSVAANGTLAVQVHGPEAKARRWYSVSLVTDRSNWMRDNADALKGKPLKEVVLPGSHDAAMYESSAGRTQGLNFYQQLASGVRFFDVRVLMDGGVLKTHHGPAHGPTMKVLMDDVRRFMEEEPRGEVAIFKIRDCEDWNEADYRKLTSIIVDTVGRWLPRRTWTGRLADQTVATLAGASGGLIFVVTGNPAANFPTPGIYVYRDHNARNPREGDLTVYDQYANATFAGPGPFLAGMVKDQLDKFKSYDGRCPEGPNVPCDLFLLSWTCTPPLTGVGIASKPANRRLAVAVREGKLNRNPQGYVPNILFTDYVEDSHSTDLAIQMNRLIPAGSRPIPAVIPPAGGEPRPP